MKVYVVYQCGYDESEFMEILGVFQNKGKAKQCYLENVSDNVEHYNFIYDEECKMESINDKHNMTRLFKGYQENWNNYLEIHIEEQEIL